MCGIAGVWDVERAYELIYDLLLALQHRGQETAGMVIEGFKVFKGRGLVQQVFDQEAVSQASYGIGHVRYSTFGASPVAQPLIALTRKGRIAISHNGNIPDADRRFEEVLDGGGIFFSGVDTELFFHYISKAPQSDPVSATLWALKNVRAAYSLIVMHDDFMLAARDPYGFRPLFMGKFQDGYVIASEDVALKGIGATDIKEIDPGVAVIFKDGKVYEERFAKAEKRFCVFEMIYFASPASTLEGKLVHELRMEMGAQVYREHPIDADLVVPVLDSGLSGAIGYSRESGIPLQPALMRNRYLGRSFIMPAQRSSIVRRKHIPVPEMVKGKRIVIVDDSLVRGTTMKRIVSSLKEAGARQVHVAIHSPPVKFPCYYGIDTARSGGLVASKMSVEEIRKLIGADGLYYLSMEGLKKVVGRRGLCMACLDGNYPVL